MKRMSYQGTFGICIGARWKAIAQKFLRHNQPNEAKVLTSKLIAMRIQRHRTAMEDA